MSDVDPFAVVFALSWGPEKRYSARRTSSSDVAAQNACPLAGHYGFKFGSRRRCYGPSNDFADQL